MKLRQKLGYSMFIVGWVIIFAGCGGDDLIPEQDTPPIPIISMKEIRVKEWWWSTPPPPGYKSQSIDLYFRLEASQPLSYNLAVDVVIWGTRIWENSIIRRRAGEDFNTIIRRRGEKVEFKKITSRMWWATDGQVRESKFSPDYPVKTLTIEILPWDKNRTIDGGILTRLANWRMARDNPYKVGSPSLRTWNSPSNFEEDFK